MGVGGQRPSGVALPQGERLSTHCTGICVDPRAGQDGYGKPRPHRGSIRGPSRSSESTIWRHEVKQWTMTVLTAHLLAKGSMTRYLLINGYQFVIENSLRSAALTFRHRASCIKDRRFTTLQRTLFIYLINKYISLSDICLTVHHWYK